MSYVPVNNSTVAAALATASASISVNSQKITSLADPTSGQDAASKSYVDTLANGFRVHPPVLVRTTANITLSNSQTVDGVALTGGERVLVANQSTGSQNGIYLAVNLGAWTRVTDMAVAYSAAASFAFVERGTTYADTGWLCTNDPGSDVVGTDALVFAQFSTYQLSGATPANVGTTGSGGSSSSASKSDHVHDLPFSVWNAVAAEANASIDINAQKITNLGTPTVASDAVTKSYADGLVAVLSGRRRRTVTVPSTGNYTVQTADDFVASPAQTVAVTYNLTPSPTTGDEYEIKDNGGTAGAWNITVAGNGHNIDGASTYVMLNAYQSDKFTYNGTQWNAS